MKKIILSSVSLFLVPFLLNAATVEEIIGGIGGLIKLLIPITAALALLFFFWGLAMFILSTGNESKQTEGKGIMVWGIIALFVMISVWGIVTVLQETFGVEDSTAPTLPKIPSGSGGVGFIGGTGAGTTPF